MASRANSGEADAVLVDVQLHLAGGRTWRTRLPAGSDALRELLSALSGRSSPAGGRPAALLEVPLDGGRRALSFPADHLIGIETDSPLERPPERAEPVAADTTETERETAVLARTTSAARLARSFSRRGITRDRIRGADLAPFYRDLRRLGVAPRMERVAALLPRGEPLPARAGTPLWGVIVETRRHPLLESVVRNVSDALAIPIQIFHGRDTAEFVRSGSIGGLVENGRVVLTPLSTNRLEASEYNALLLSLRFWEHVRAAGSVFLFQTDSLVCTQSPWSVEDFLDFAYIGAGWSRRRPIGLVADGGVGGSTLRHKPTLMECLRRFPPDAWPGGEDGYYAFHLDLMGARIGRGVECERFCTQSAFRERSLCCHKPSLLGAHDRERFRAYCPEAAPLLDRRG